MSRLLRLQSQQTKRSHHGEDRTHGLLFAHGYNDRLLLRQGQLGRCQYNSSCIKNFF